jgi:hypothetical protein
MISAGIDLSAEPKGTALALLDFNNNKAKLFLLEQGLTDQDLIDKTINADKIGIDCALGWPIKFFEFLRDHQDLENQTLIDGGLDYRRTLAYRETDREIHRLTGRWPLSVATDRLGLTAIRAAGLLSKYQASGVAIDRSGEGKLAEVYPGGTLRNWQLETKNYRVDKQARQKLLDQLLGFAPWLELGEHHELMLGSTDCFDAVVAALATRAAYKGQYQKPSQDQKEAARVEGWICLPTEGIQALL